jgi:hypothetical protein
LAFFENGHQRQRDEHQPNDRENDDLPAFFWFCHVGVNDLTVILPLQK